MGTLQTNFVSGTLSAGIGNSDTTISSSGFANLPVVSGSDIIKLIIDPFGEDGAPEVVFVTTHAASATTVTNCLRGQDIDDNAGAARSHDSGTLFIHAPVASDWQDLMARANAIINAPGTNLATGAPDGLVAGGPNVTGAATAVSRADHKHALPVAAPVVSNPGDTQGAGTAPEVARADHQHQREAFEVAPANIGPAAAPGVAPTVARGDHVHKIGTGAINDATMYGGAVRAFRTATLAAMPVGMPVGSMVWLTDKNRLAVLRSVGPDVWSYDLSRMPYSIARRVGGEIAPTGLSGSVALGGFTAMENGGVTVTTTGLTIPNPGLWEVSAQAGFASVSGSVGMVRLFAVQVNGGNLDPQMTASGDALGSGTAGFGYSPGNVTRILRLATGNTIRVLVRHNYSDSIAVSCILWAYQVGE